MRSILIIATPRSGSTNLLNSIASAYNFSNYFEPVPPVHIKFESVTKLISYPRTSSNENFYQGIIQQADYIILLDRLDSIKQTESLYALKEISRPLYGNEYAFNKKWIPSDFPKDYYNSKEYKEYKDMLSGCKDTLEWLSTTNNIKINYYEDVYSNKCLLDKSIKLDLDYLDKSKTLRVDTLKTKPLI